jgi:hypothetical protein
VIPGIGGLWHCDRMIRTALFLTINAIVLSGAALADPPTVVAASAVQDGDGTWTISVSLQHPDTGWDHYASGWQVLTPDGTVIGYRELTHPHVDEQPFTRSLSGVKIPGGLREVLIQPRCTMDGWVPMPTMLTLPQN